MFSRLLFTCPVYLVPGQPVNVQAKQAGPTRIDLSWEAPLHSTAIVGYLVQINSSDAKPKELELSGHVETYTVQDLKPDTDYSFRVAAKSIRGQGVFSRYVTERTSPSGSIDIF